MEQKIAAYIFSVSQTDSDFMEINFVDMIPVVTGDGMLFLLL